MTIPLDIYPTDGRKKLFKFQYMLNIKQNSKGTLHYKLILYIPSWNDKKKFFVFTIFYNEEF